MKKMNTKKDLTFYKLSLGSMICGFITFGFVIITLLFLLISPKEQEGIPEILNRIVQTGGMIGIGGAALAVLTMGILNIAQAVAGSHYGDVGSKLTRENAIKTFIICLAVFGGCVLLLLIWRAIPAPQVDDPTAEDLRYTVDIWWWSILDAIFSSIFIAGILGSIMTHTGVNTAIVVKLHQPKK